MDSEITLHFTSQIGQLSLEIKEGQLCSLSISNKASVIIGACQSNSDKKIVTDIFQQLQAYFSLTKAFKSLPLLPSGTDFQKLVWLELLKIPLGETRTYGDIAKNLNTSARAVGNACRKNPIQLIVPCHRVISAKGIGGYAGETDGEQLNIKRWLLKHEGVLL